MEMEEVVAILIQIVIAGDYGDNGKWVPEDYQGNLYDYSKENFRDVSQYVIKAAGTRKEKRW